MTFEFEQDIDGYPTDTTLNIIKFWKGDFSELMKFIAPYFNGAYGRCENRSIDDAWEVVTGGWSGCESVIQALKENTVFWLVCWYLSKRGGYYEFRVTR